MRRFQDKIKIKKTTVLKFKIMCILFCYTQRDDEKCDLGYELILLVNRDEDFGRPTLPAHVWPKTNFVLGGKNYFSVQTYKILIVLFLFYQKKEEIN